LLDIPILLLWQQFDGRMAAPVLLLLLLLLLLLPLLLLPQAVCARDWLRSNGNVAAMQPGWTYMFEAVYSDNTHVVRYPFEGLVLLGAVSPEGAELPDAAARQQLAEQLGVMAVPSIDGALPELLQRLGRECSLADATESSNKPSATDTGKTAQRRAHETSVNSDSKGSNSSSSSTGNFEGWVVQSQQQRCKLVLQQFLQAGHAASQQLHPLMVWDAVFRGKSHAQLAEGLPAHFAAELDAMLTVLDLQF
jgi:hypothetical protein